MVNHVCPYWYIWVHILTHIDPYLHVFPRSKNVIVVVYDNGCKLEEYFLNRMPEWLRNRLIVIDAFHFGKWYTMQHKCGGHFDIKAYMDLSNVASSGCEHVNSQLKAMKGSLRTVWPVS